RTPGLTHTPILTIQIVLGLAGNAALLLNPGLFALISDPNRPSGDLAAADGVMGWLTFALNAVVVCLHLRLTRMRGGAHVLGGLGVAAVILVACTGSNCDDKQHWLRYHVLMLGFVVLGRVIPALRWIQAR